LELRQVPCTADDLLKLLSHTPALTALSLSDLPQVPSLFFFCQLPELAGSLLALTVECDRRWN
jgi:hypothetical protein